MAHKGRQLRAVIQSSHQSRQEAQDLQANAKAKRAVEVAIEDGEEKALYFLKQ